MPWHDDKDGVFRHARKVYRNEQSESACPTGSFRGHILHPAGRDLIDHYVSIMMLPLNECLLLRHCRPDLRDMHFN